MSDTRTQILDLAERAIRLRGYHAVSFRDFADELGIKSASIHYYFRHKEDLGLALVDRYAERIKAGLGGPGDHPWHVALSMFCRVYRDALHKSELQCLCGMLAAESPGLPDIITTRVTRFFRDNLDWLAASMPPNTPNKQDLALTIQCRLQGAMTVAVSLQDPGVLDKAIAGICAETTGRG